ncbi:alpha-ketoglutarate-dependent dioxygenase alkB homolog 7, mitochondrial-like [Homarus americanus]|uniref:alpha-ketoglutarate-dependent dioxygenase alkB homolog 7, mitochondrial-like n=1 Tax=Homarus americanus TaxID=6706 RepID=UPI001C46BEAB|nr:alpha-ketoglutarate-dependent dioxygenase alkB homolog 7, mitochondrial-like [Homarus americanus]XP_042222657.1 alpha-ketoglutarate-dependent dioxygenase alkB homolog 7, mitochondrial-like [Homarus americanus]
MNLGCLYTRYIKDSLNNARQLTRSWSRQLQVVIRQESALRYGETSKGAIDLQYKPLMNNCILFKLQKSAETIAGLGSRRRLYSGYSKFSVQEQRWPLRRSIGCDNSPGVKLLSSQHTEVVDNLEVKDIIEPTRVPEYFYFHASCSSNTRSSINSSFEVVNNFVSEDEEEVLMKEIEPHLKRLKYEYNHWDDAIHGFRETERSRWGEASAHILTRIRQYAFPTTEHQLPQSHILDLAKTGVIKPHVDSVKFCGNIICGLCLLSDAVMRLVHVEHHDQVIDINLRRRSLYVMKDESRYKYTHEVLGAKESYFGSQQVPRERRVSIMCRNSATQDGS